MIPIIPKSVAGTKITVTGTATKLYPLMDTAGSETGSEIYYSKKLANAIIITPEGGDIRILFGADPTATQGRLLKDDTMYFIPGMDLSDLRLIAVAGTPLVSVELYQSEPSESLAGVSTGGGGSSGGSSSTGGGNSTWSNVQGDFTATANSGAKTITLSAFASTVASTVLTTKNFANAVIKRITSGGAVDALPMTNVAYVNATGVLTLSDMTANFAVGDTVAVFIPCNDKAYDEVNDWAKNADQLAPQYEDNLNGVACTQNKPVPVSTYAWSVDRSTALEASTVTKATAGVLRLISGRIDSTHASATYYLQVLNASSLPADGAVTTLVAPTKLVHVTGTDTPFNLDFTMNGVYASTGIVVCLSTTEFTKTISGAFLSSTVLYI